MIDFATLYSWVRDLPIIDWHNHLDMKMLAGDRPLGSLYEVWVKSDPYKHRAMRICGEAERLITGVPFVAGESEKWAAWMRTMPKLVGNPLFAWAKMELEWLGIDPEPYLHGRGANISLHGWTPSKMLAKFGVEYISPCVGTEGLDALGQRASCPLSNAPLGQRASRPLSNAPLGQRASRPLANAPLGQRASRPLANAPLGQRASCPLTWTAPEVKEFPLAQASASSHFSHTLAAGSFHSRNLPHIGQSSTMVFVTFRLADSLPQSRLDELEAFKDEWLKNHPVPWDEATCREWELALFPKIEEWLDAGHGSCFLADPTVRKVVEDALEYFNESNGQDARCPSECNGQDARCPSECNGRDARCPSECNGRDARCPSMRYRLHGYVVMPNHVHVLFELFDGEGMKTILHSWKSFTAKKINRLTGRSGKVWKEEYYDRLIRNDKHYQNTLRYIRRNGDVAKALAESNGFNGQDARCPSESNGQDARCPSEGNGQDARCPSIVPSLRMNAGDAVSVETLEKFHAVGCRVVDISVDDVSQLATNYCPLATVSAFAVAHGWTMLLHLGALRETSARLRAAAGPAGGFAGMRSPVDPAAVAAFLDALEGASNPFGRVGTSLPRTILMSLNPEAHAQLAVLSGSFVEAGVPGKVQLGPAWWWCDHEAGIRDVLEKNAAYGVLSTFVGMTTDSRSLLSLVRHDFFRRVLCRWVAEKVAFGEFPDDESLLRPMLAGICHGNARRMLMADRMVISDKEEC